MNINDDQFQGLADAVNTWGGFTAHASGPKVGQTPTNMFSVGTEAEGRHHPLPETNLSLKQFAQQHAATLDRPGRLLGGWASKGRAWQDVPRGYPITPQGEVGARHATLRENQEAFGVLGTEAEGFLGEIAHPFHPETLRGADITPGNPEADAPVWANMPKHTGVTSDEHLRRHQGKGSHP